MSTRVRALLVPVGSDLYAIDTDHAREVVIAPRITRLPTGPRTVLGLYNLRGEIVPLFDTAALLDLGSIAAPAFAVIVATAFGPAALAATALPRVLTLEDMINPSELPGTAGTFSHDDQLIVLLDLDELISARVSSAPGLRRSA